MSLKAFHLAFISLSVVLTFGFGIWTLTEGSGLYTFYGLFSFISSLALIIYVVKFLKKFRDVSYL